MASAAHRAEMLVETGRLGLAVGRSGNRQQFRRHGRMSRQLAVSQQRRGQRGFGHAPVRLVQPVAAAHPTAGIAPEWKLALQGFIGAFLFVSVYLA